MTADQLKRRWVINGVTYRINTHGNYAQYQKGETWRESARVTNQMLLELQNEL